MKRLHQAKLKAISDLKDETSKQILIRHSSWKQHNDLAQAHLLLSKKVDLLISQLGAVDPLSAPDKAKLDTAQQALRSVRRLVGRGKELESKIEAGETPDITQGWDQV